MKVWALLFACLVASLAQAEREITIPKGKKIRDNRVRAEILGVPGEKFTKTWLGTGFLQAYDFEWTTFQDGQSKANSSFDFSYNFAPPIMDISPGISIGVQDSLNRSEDGRGVYVASTFQYGNEGDNNQNIPTEFTFGFWTKKTGLFFAGASLPLSEKLILLCEHNSKRLAAGIEIRPFTGATFKTVFEQSGTSFGLALSRRF